MSRQNNKQKFNTKMILFVILVIVIGILSLFNRRGMIPSFDQANLLQEDKMIIELDPLVSNYIGVNTEQIFKVTKDGIVAYDLYGEELWLDTLSLDNYIVKQRDPYIAIGNKNGNAITIFNNKGKQGQINFQNPILYFSINKHGSVAVIEDLKDSHIISVYDATGKSLGVKRVSHIKEKGTGYPLTAEISPDNSILLISYVNVDHAMVSSNLLAIQIQKPKDEKTDTTLYGIQQEDNLIYAIEFIRDNEWVSIGDKVITWYNLAGKEVNRQENMMVYYTPYVKKISQYGEGFFPIVRTTNFNKNVLHKENEVIYYNAKGESSFNLFLKEPVTYFYADDQGIVIGHRSVYVGYNKMGKKMFEFETATNVEKVFYLFHKKTGIAVTKDSVILLNKRGRLDSDD